MNDGRSNQYQFPNSETDSPAQQLFIAIELRK
jgi:hypothetical protein